MWQSAHFLFWLTWQVKSKDLAQKSQSKAGMGKSKSLSARDPIRQPLIYQLPLKSDLKLQGKAAKYLYKSPQCSL